jgi:hypothetical protein
MQSRIPTRSVPARIRGLVVGAQLPPRQHQTLIIIEAATRSPGQPPVGTTRPCGRSPPPHCQRSLSVRFWPAPHHRPPVHEGRPAPPLFLGVYAHELGARGERRGAEEATRKPAGNVNPRAVPTSTSFPFSPPQGAPGRPDSNGGREKSQVSSRGRGARAARAGDVGGG